MQTTTRRILATTAAAGVLSIATALPATAIPEPGSPGSADNSQRHDQGLYLRRTAHGAAEPTTSANTTTNTREVVVDHDVEYLQIGLGALAGMAVAGAAAVGVRRLGHRAPHPA